MREESISAVLPLKLSGRHYGDNLGRCDLLFGTMRHFGWARLFSEILIVVPGEELAAIRRHAEAWSDFPLRLVAEDSFLGVFREYRGWHQVRPWHRQQIIKLFSARLLSSEFFLTLDPDVLALRPVSYGDFVQDGRALLEPEPRRVHPDWWQASAHLLGLDPAAGSVGMSVTPALLSREICFELGNRLGWRHGRDWVRVLLENYAIDWTEYTLYYLVAESSGLLSARHRPPGEGEPRLLAPYQVRSAEALDRSRLAALFAVPQRDFFCVAQSSAGMSAAEIAACMTPALRVAPRAMAEVGSRRGLRLGELAGASIRRAMRPLMQAGR